ncbi:hypothetical protein BST27_18565 [Mycobacterium intermedium]|uniref:Uncharacterized protein n=1 Tax=Mycobacterium intermedium TaxID=28445 RepID=A0A1E3SF08_MYCIE|nr:hypothetical protein [Mycobacterium intermedium]MCV6963078.1 hypothetical protein [Mycobacterium intermedium]ODR00675.1 hypothetical protein BHQ20_11835 [Mycobacterium intermedium]OPE52293.1 hypothetical protein BV508_02815 [Mycobacterium intermedium]ORB00267.1 hypothetical protein BST27_18565 [Mycobacterium intermedium]
MSAHTDDFDMTQFPHIFNAVLDVMPTRDAWLARFAEQPGGTTVLPGDDDWLTVLHRGDVVMRLHLDAFKPGAILSDAKIMIGGEWQQVRLEWRDG